MLERSSPYSMGSPFNAARSSATAWAGPWPPWLPPPEQRSCRRSSSRNQRSGDPLGECEFGKQSEDEFVATGFAQLLDRQQNDAEQQPTGFKAAHLGITRMAAPHALHRGAASLGRGTNPTVRSLLKDLPMSRYYLQGETTPGGPQEDLVRAGVEWRTVPRSGHPMGLQNPFGFAAAVADAIRAT
jgi:hypothetical protein